MVWCGTCAWRRFHTTPYIFLRSEAGRAPGERAKSRRIRHALICVSVADVAGVVSVVGVLTVPVLRSILYTTRHDARMPELSIRYGREEVRERWRTTVMNSGAILQKQAHRQTPLPRGEWILRQSWRELL